MDPLSIAVGVASLITFTGELSRSLVAYSKAVKRGREDLHLLLTEVSLLQSSLQRLDSFLRSSDVANVTFHQTSALEASLVVCKETAIGLNERLRKLEAAGFASAVEKLKWPFSAKEVAKVLETLRRCTSTFQFSLTLEGCKLLSQASGIAESSLEIQRTNAQKIVELSQTIASIKNTSQEASRVSAQLSDILYLIKDHTVNSSEMQRLTDGIDSLNIKAQEEADNKALDWLASAHHAQKHREICRKRLPNTGMWLLECDEYRRWSENMCSTMCCTGGPGVGKSFLTSLVVDHVQSDLESTSQAMAFFYFDYQLPKTHTLGAFSASLLRQLCSQMSVIPNSLRQLYRRHKSEEACGFPSELAAILLNAATCFDSCCVIVDAVDECLSLADRKAILHLLASMEGPNMRIFISTRPHCAPALGTFRDYQVLAVEARTDDIRAYCGSVIESNDITTELLDYNLREQVLDIIANHAQGMFLLAVLHMQGITEALTKSEIRRYINTLSADLGQAFSDTLHRIKDQSPRRKQLALRSLIWVSSTYRPLSAHELCHALATEVGHLEFDEDALLNPKVIVESCLGLINIDQGTMQARLVHLALKDYLQKVNLRIESTMDNETYITATLLTYLCFGQGSVGTNESKYVEARRALSDSFYAYATWNWGYHAKTASAAAIRQQALTYLQRMSANVRDLPTSIDTPKTASMLWPTNSFRGPHLLTGLHIAAGFGLSELVVDMLEIETNINAVDSDYNTALHIAVTNGQLRAAMVLLRANADPNSENTSGRTPLYDAVALSHVPLATALLDYGAAVDAECEDIWSPLHKAADVGDLEITRLLISRGASVLSESARELIPLHRAAGQGHLDVIKELLQAGSPVDSATVDGWTPLHGACNSGQAEAAELLIAYFAKVDWKSNDGRSALHRACRGSHHKTVQILLKHRADVLVNDDEGDIALHWAAKAGCLAICEALLKNDEASTALQLTTLNNEKRTPREEAMYQGHLHTADVLKEHELKYGMVREEPPNNLELAMTSNHDLLEFKQLLEEAAQSDPTIHKNTKLLHRALLSNNEAIARYLIDLPTTDLSSRTDDGQQPLHCAASSTNSALVQLCLDRYAPIHATTHDGQTPLHKACKTGDLSSVSLLLGAGADIDVEDRWGWTPLHTASFAGSQPVVEALLDRGANLYWEDTKGRTPHVCAAEAGNHALCQFLRQQQRPRWDFRKAAQLREL